LGLVGEESKKGTPTMGGLIVLAGNNNPQVDSISPSSGDQAFSTYKNK